MKPEELKKMIKGYVRECLTEVLAEKFLQTIVQEAVVAGLKGAKVIHDAAAPEVRASAPQQRRSIPATRTPLTEDSGHKALKNLGVKDPLMESIFKDTLQSNNPLVTGEEASGVEVPESALEQIGVFNKDWDRYIK